jgi:hypothetical protein
MSAKTGNPIAFKMEIKDTDVSGGHAVGKKVYFFPVELESELPRIFRAAIVHPHPSIYEEDFAKSFVNLNKVRFRELRSLPMNRGDEYELNGKVGLPFPSSKTDRSEFTQKTKEHFRQNYANYVSVVPLLVSQRTKKEKANPAFGLLPEKAYESTELASPPYYRQLRRMVKTHAYLIHKGQVHKPICSACAFITKGIAGDCHPLDKLCRDRMSIPGLSLAEEVKKNTDKYVQNFEGDSYDYLLSESTECIGVPDALETPGTAASDRRHNALVPPGDKQLGNVVASPIPERAVSDLSDPEA